MLLKKIEKREIELSDLNRLNPLLKIEHVGTVRKVADSKVLSLHPDYRSLVDRFCAYYNLPDDIQFKSIIFNIFLRNGEREYAIEHRTKNLPEGYFCIPLNANKYTIKSIHPVLVRSMYKLGGYISYRKMRYYMNFLENCPVFAIEKGKFHFGKDGEGKIVPNEDNVLTKIRYLGRSKDSFFNRQLAESQSERIVNFNDYILMKVIGKLSFANKKKSHYGVYKEKFLGSSIIRHSHIHYTTKLKTKKETTKPFISFCESEAGILEKLNKHQKNIIKNDTVFEELRLTRIFKDYEGFGGRFYSKFHRWSSAERKKASSYLGYTEYDITSSMVNQRRVWDKDTIDINEDFDAYEFALKTTNLFSNKQKTDYDYNKLHYYRKLVKTCFVTAIGSGMNMNLVEHILIKNLVQMGAIYSLEDTEKLQEIKKQLLLEGLSIEDVYREPKYYEQRSLCASNRHKLKKAYELKNDLNPKHSLTLKSSYKLIKTIKRAIYNRFSSSLDINYILQAQDAESMATLKYIKYKLGQGELALSCHDSLYTNNKSEYDTFKTQVKVNTLKLKNEEDISLNPLQKRKNSDLKICKNKIYIYKKASQKTLKGIIGNLYNNIEEFNSQTGPPDI